MKDGVSEKIEGHSPQHPPALSTQLEGGGRLPLPFFENQKRTLILSIFELIFLFKVQGEKTPNFTMRGLFSFIF